jgi:hypothetical protein
MLKVIPKEYFDGNRGTLKLLWEEEWRALGITQVWLLLIEENIWELTYYRVSVGSITKFTNQNLISYYSSKSLTPTTPTGTSLTSQ